MKETYKALFEPLRLRSGKELKNRIVMAPMGNWGSLPGGFISEEELTYYGPRVKDAGMIITSATTFTEGEHYPGAPAALTDEHIPGLKKLSSLLKSNGAVAILQLFHGGALKMKNPEAPSAVAPENSDAEPPHELTDSEIEDLIKKFGDATRRIIEAGFDGVEIHGANGYLMQQFISPHYNRRQDRWGGTFEKRLAVPLALIKEAKKARAESGKSFAIGYRISPEEQFTNGLTMADAIQIVDVLADQELDYIHVSLHNFFSKPRRGIESKRSRMEILKELVGNRTALIGVGEITTPEQAASALSSGVELVALGRALLLDPNWLNKVREGREDQIKNKLFHKDLPELLFPKKMWEHPDILPLIQDTNNLNELT
ncbi:NADH-dependent flavin oxidoreductase [Paenibacillus rhizosphaerae]